jgi:hypothetical protein
MMDAQCFILDKYVAAVNKTNNKPRYKFKSRLMTSETINYFTKELSYGTWNEVYHNTDVKSAFNELSIFLNIYEASFPIVYLSNSNAKSWITTGIKISCLCKIFLHKIIKNSNNPKIKIYLKKYYLILAMPWLKRLVTGFPPWWPRFKTWSSHVGFVVDKVALGQVFSKYFGFPYQSSFHQFLHNHPHLSSGSGTIGQ